MKNKNSKIQDQKKQELKSITKRGVKVIFSGLAVLLAGFLVLTKTDPMGQNLASDISPFLIIGGYIVIGIGIILPEKDPGQSLNQVQK
jgi:hypothetical protein